MALHIPTQSDICAYVYTSKTITSVRRTCPRGNVALNGEGKEKLAAGERVLSWVEEK